MVLRINLELHSKISFAFSQNEIINPNLRLCVLRSSEQCTPLLFINIEKKLSLNTNNRVPSLAYVVKLNI